MDAGAVEPRRPLWQMILDGVVAASTLVVAIVVVHSFATRPGIDVGEGKRPALFVPAEPVSIDGAALKGDTRARVVLIEYADFECRFCGSFAKDVLPLLQEKYIDTGRVAFALKHLPLPRNQHALLAAQAAECAGRQSKFWKMHDWLFANPARLERVAQEAVPELQLDLSTFRTCLGEDAVSTRVQQDRAEARKFQITSTPTFLLGTRDTGGQARVIRRIPGAVPARVFVAAIDQVLLKTNP